MQVPHTKALMTSIVERAMARGGRNLDTWAFQGNDDPGKLLIAPHDGASWQTVDADVVARGVWRATGGQQMDRPEGITKEMVAELERALGNMDADHLDPHTASALIQVGLYGKVRYP